MPPFDDVPRDHKTEDLGSASRVRRGPVDGDLQASFENFLIAISLADCSQIQRTEMRRAFFAGAWSVLCELSSPDDVAAAAKLKSMRDACVDFKNRVERGEA